MNAAHAAVDALSRVEPGFAQPVFDSQAAFRAALQAMARPGSLHLLPAPEARPTGLAPATASLLLALADPDTRLWLSPAFANAAAYLRFHTGCPIAADRFEADFALIDGIDGLGGMDDYRPGTEDYPDRSTTLIVQVSHLHAGTDHSSFPGVPLRLTGPGIEHSARIEIAGAGREFVEHWRARRSLFPCGNDLFFVCGDSLAAIPRSTAMEVDSECM